MKRKIRFLGLLANVDSSILNMKFKHGLKIESMDVQSAIQFFAALEGISSVHAHTKISHDFPCVSPDDRIYYLTKEFQGSHIGGIETNKFSNRVVLQYIFPTLRLMRLFQKGNIFMPKRYYYYSNASPPRAVMSESIIAFVESDLFSLGSNTKKLLSFLKNTSLPFKESFLQLAFDNFETSFHVRYHNIIFLLLMISLETLFNRGKEEIAYTIRRNAAVMLGKDESDSKLIYDKIKDLYTKRSGLVHTGSAKINRDDIAYLRNTVRECIKNTYRLGKNKDELFDILNRYGFGDRRKFLS